jgi:hypothetical protein
MEIEETDGPFGRLLDVDLEYLTIRTKINTAFIGVRMFKILLKILLLNCN